MYGCQTWSLTRKDKNTLVTMQRVMERIILGISRTQKIWHTIIRGKTGMEDILSTVTKLRWKLAGHLAIMTDERWTSTVPDSIPQRRVRKVGCQNLRWTEDIEDTAGSAWARMAQYREHWHALGEAYAQKWA